MPKRMAAQFEPFDPDVLYSRLKRGRTYLDEKRGDYSLRWKSKSRRVLQQYC